MFKIKNGFTLIELLVVVVIIGILAAIALPQYKLVTGKTKFTTLKALTKSVFDSSNRYYLTNNTFPNTSYDLDIDLNIKKDSSSSGAVSFTLQDDSSCQIIKSEPNYIYTFCDKVIFGKKMRFYIDRSNPYGNNSNFTNKACLTYSVDKSDITNKICQKETGLTGSQAGCGNDYCSYRYISGYL